MNDVFEQQFIVKTSRSNLDLQNWCRELKHITPVELTFGEWDVHMLNQIPPHDEVFQETRQKILERSRSTLANLYKEEKSAVKDFVMDYLVTETQSGNPLFEAFISNQESFRKSIDETFVKNIPLESYEKMLVFHQQKVAERRIKLEEACNTYKLEFVQKVFSEIEDGYINLSKNDVSQIIEGLEISIIDDLLNTRSYGTANQRLSSMRIVDSMNLKDVRKLLFHELFHIISGITFNKIVKYDSYTGEVRVMDFETPQLGLSRSIPVKVVEKGNIHKGWKKQYVWLNEGLTEMLAIMFDQNKRLADIDSIQLINDKFPQLIYREQMKIIDMLRNKGKNVIPIKFFLDAYFEAFKEGEKPPLLPKLRELYEQIDRFFVEGYLVKLNKAMDEDKDFQFRERKEYILYDFVKRLLKNPYDFGYRLDFMSSTDEFVGREKLRLDEEFEVNERGAEKIIYPVRNNGMLCAAKIYRAENAETFERIDCDHDSLHEYKSYVSLRGSILRQYIPRPIGMIQDDEGQNNGLLVEWQNGEELSKRVGQRDIPQEKIDELENALLQLPEGVWLDFDSLLESNICWDGKNLWFAEPKLSSYSSQDAWQTIVKSRMGYLRDNYCIMG